MPLKIKELESLIKYLFSEIEKPIILIDYIISFLIIALLFYKACLISFS
jgi:hypothetical protein